MRTDLSTAAGFPLTLDAARLDLEPGGGVRFGREARHQADLAAVLLEADGADPAVELYRLFPLSDAGPAAPAFARAGLTYSCVLLPPLRVGREYVKTQGHYHPPMPGSDIAYPELYTHLSGRPYLMIQRRAGGRDDRLEDCALIELVAGRTVTIPPGYAHVLINPSDRPAAVAGLYSPSFSPVYEPIAGMAGAAYYLIDDGGERAIPNHRYAIRPPLRRPTDLAGTPLAPPDGTRPLWTSFLADPRRYAFLTDPEAARVLFAGQDDAR